MDMVLTMGLGSLKALLLLTVAAGISVALRRRPARLRAVIWGTALVGTLLIPVASVLVPAVPVAVPMAIPTPADTEPIPAGIGVIQRPQLLSDVAGQVSPTPPSVVPAGSVSWRLPTVWETLIGLWAAAALVLFIRQSVSHWQMTGIIRRAAPINDPSVLDLADDIRMEVGCTTRVRLVVSPEIDVPSVFGLFRPTVVLPTHFDAWLEDRLTAVLQHEMIHVVRFDWPVRITARLARSVYWFNPLAWWAVRRLDIEQEMACDEEVLSLGSRASSYACHLLGIARTSVHRPAMASTNSSP